ncbi:MAG: SIMPL domain-containing protein [Candidatus Cryptobacteroides sp.]
MEKSRIVSSAIVAIAITICGVCLPFAVREYRSLDRTVTVKGLCEKEVSADKAIWPINFRNASNDLTTLTRSIDRDRQMILDFLKAEGVQESEITVGAPMISDKNSMSYGVERPFRYVGKTVITVCTGNVDLVLRLSSQISGLLDKGVLIGNENEWENRIQYNFEGLNEIKPEMIREATANARLAAEQFAKDSGSHIGKIKTASQGSFSIDDRDSNTPQIKRVRVVTSITYTLVK